MTVSVQQRKHMWIGSPLSSDEKVRALCSMRRGRSLYPDREVPRPCSCLRIYDFVHESNQTPQICAVPDFVSNKLVWMKVENSHWRDC